MLDSKQHGLGVDVHLPARKVWGQAVATCNMPQSALPMHTEQGPLKHNTGRTLGVTHARLQPNIVQKSSPTTTSWQARIPDTDAPLTRRSLSDPLFTLRMAEKEE